MAVFVKAVDLGSFAAAADALGLSAPMVGKHVRALEDRLGARLIHRTTRRQSLTDLGREYCQRCRLILAEVDAADAVAAHRLAEPRGTLRVTAPVHFGRCCVMPVLMGLLASCPALDLDLSFTDRFADLAEDGYDLAVRTGAPGKPTGLTGRVVARQRMIVCAAPAYLETTERPSTVADLARHTGIVYRRSGVIPPWRFPDEGGTVVEVLPKIRTRMDDLAAIADAAVDGAGLAWLPSWLVRDRLASGALVDLLPDQPGLPYLVSALWVSTDAVAPKTRAAVDRLARDLPAFMEG